MTNELRLALVRVVYDHATRVIERRELIGDKFDDARLNRAVGRYHNIIFTVLALHGYDSRNPKKRDQFVSFCDRCFWELIQEV